MSEQLDDSVVRVCDAVISATTSHFLISLKIKFLSTSTNFGEIDELKLRNLTAVIGVSGPVRALVAFSFDMDLANHLLAIETEGLDIPSDEQVFYRLDMIAETVNLVLGHCTKNLAVTGQPIGLTPPIVLEDAGSLRRPKGAIFSSISHNTSYGVLDVVFITPPELYGDNLSLNK